MSETIKNPMKRIVVLSDGHAGSRVGLTPPKWWVERWIDSNEDPSFIKYLNIQKETWKWFSKEIKSLYPIDILIYNGDAIDGLQKKSGGMDLAYPSIDEQKEIAYHSIVEAQAKEYRKIREKHGDDAKSNSWMQRNGYRYILIYILRTLKMSWNDFKKLAGFNDSPFYIYWTKEIAIKEYQVARKKYGDKAKSSHWMMRNGHEKLIKPIYKFFGSWPQFVKMAEAYFELTTDQLKYKIGD